MTRTPFLDGKQKQLLIDGKWVEAQSGRTFDTINPYNGKVLATVAHGDAADVDLAVAAARRAFEGPWKQFKPVDRQRVLLRLADLIEQKKAGHPIAKTKVKTEGNVINLMDALRQSLKGGKAAPAAAKATPAKGKKSKKRIEGQREMLFPIEGKKTATKETERKPAKRPAKAPAAKRKAG